MEYVIKTNALTKKFGRNIAVNNVSLGIRKGDIYGIIGRNGAGKSTVMKLLLGITFPNSGEIELFGSTELSAGRKRIGSIIESPTIYKGESAIENMKRFAILSNTPEEELHRLLALVGLSKTGRKKAGSFSLGMRQRLAIAIALIGSPELLVLDEPTNGLDPAGIKEIRDLILELNAKGVTFLISSHLLDELGKVATRYGIMSGGVLTEELTAEEVEKHCRTGLRIKTDDKDKALAVISKAYPEARVESDDGYVHIYSDIEDNSVFVELLVKKGVRVYEAVNECKPIESFFVERMGR